MLLLKPVPNCDYTRSDAVDAVLINEFFVRSVLLNRIAHRSLCARIKRGGFPAPDLKVERSRGKGDIISKRTFKRRTRAYFYWRKATLIAWLKSQDATEALITDIIKLPGVKDV